MYLSDNIVDTVAARAASILTEWLGLSPLAKSDNGDQSGAGGLAMIMNGMLAAKAPAPPDDALIRMAKHIRAEIARRTADRDDMYLVFDSDYGPGHELSALATACGIASAWPWKSSVTITSSSNGITISDRRGYGSEGVSHHLINDVGWLVSPCRIDQRIIPTVLGAVERNEIDPFIARLDAFQKGE